MMKKKLFDECVVQLLKTWSYNVELKGSSSHTSKLYVYLNYLSKLNLEFVFHDYVHNVTNGICEYNHILLIMVKESASNLTTCNHLCDHKNHVLACCLFIIN